MQLKVAFGVAMALLVAACSNADDAVDTNNTANPSTIPLASWQQLSDGTLTTTFDGQVPVVVRCWRQGDMQDCIGGSTGTKLLVRRQLDALPDHGGLFDALGTTGFVCRLDDTGSGYTQMLRTSAGVIKLAAVPASSPMSRAEMLELMSANDMIGPDTTVLFNCGYVAEAIEASGMKTLVSTALDYNEIDTMADPAPAATPRPAPEQAVASPVTNNAPFQWISSENALIRQWYKANDDCRGGMGADTQRACDQREVVQNRLFEIGICYGEVDQIGADMHMHRCHSRSSQMNY